MLKEVMLLIVIVEIPGTVAEASVDAVTQTPLANSARIVLDEYPKSYEPSPTVSKSSIHIDKRPTLSCREPITMDHISGGI
jgi:hypothetical protein